MSEATISEEPDIPTFDEGSGPVILIVHPGFDDGTSWTRVARKLPRRFRVIMPLRRQYRPAAKTEGPVSIGEEAREIRALATAVSERMVIVGHSSGGIVALETILAASSPLFAGAVIYEPPLVIGPPLGGDALERARAALAAGKPGKAMQIFTLDIAGASAALAWLTRALVALTPNTGAVSSINSTTCRRSTNSAQGSKPTAESGSPSWSSKAAARPRASSSGRTP